MKPLSVCVNSVKCKPRGEAGVNPETGTESSKLAHAAQTFLIGF